MPSAIFACCAIFAATAVSARDFDLPDHVTLSEQQHRAAIARLWQARQNPSCVGEDCPHHRHTRSIAYDDPEFEDYPEERGWMKRSSQPSPYISLGALSNLPQFFSELRGTMGALEHEREEEAQAQQAHQTAVDADRAFRPPSTAAFLNAFRNYRPLRRTRSYPPALVHG